MVEPGDLGQPQAPHDRLGRLVEDRGDRPDLRQADAVAFASRLMDAKDGVDLDTVRDDLAAVVHAALEPAHISVWVRPG
jgi:hypothetical protein